MAGRTSDGVAVSSSRIRIEASGACTTAAGPDEQAGCDDAPAPAAAERDAGADHLGNAEENQQDHHDADGQGVKEVRTEEQLDKAVSVAVEGGHGVGVEGDGL